MKKQRLFKADGAGTTILGPLDKAAVLSIAKNWGYQYSEKADSFLHGDPFGSGNRGWYAGRFSYNGKYADLQRDLGLFKKLLGDHYCDYMGERTVSIYTDSTYQFNAKDVVTVCQEMAKVIEGWPDKTTAEADREKGYRQWAMSKNYLGTVVYRIPFDESTYAANKSAVADADKKRSDADKTQAEADKAKAEAGTMKAVRIGVVAVVGAVIVALIVKIAKK